MTLKTRQQIEAEIAQLEAANAAAPGWGAAVGARLENIRGLRSALDRLPAEQLTSTQRPEGK